MRTKNLENTKETLENTKETLENSKETLENTKETIENTKETIENPKKMLSSPKPLPPSVTRGLLRWRPDAKEGELLLGGERGNRLDQLMLGG